MEALEKTFDSFRVELEAESAQRKALKEALQGWEETTRRLLATLLHVHTQFAKRTFSSLFSSFSSDRASPSRPARPPPRPCPRALLPSSPSSASYWILYFSRSDKTSIILCI